MISQLLEVILLAGIGMPYLSAVPLPVCTFQSLLLFKESHQSMFSGKTAGHENVAWLTWGRIRTSCPFQGKPLATEFYRNRCNNPPHDTGTVVEYTVFSHTFDSRLDYIGMWPNTETCEDCRNIFISCFNTVNSKYHLHVCNLSAHMLFFLSKKWNTFASLHVNRDIPSFQTL